MSAQLGGQPILILKEGGSRTRGRDAQSMNIAAAKAVAGAVRTTLGPKGMDKMLVDTIGDVVITNDGVTILKEMDIEHPAAKMMVEVAKTQDDEVGDGTTSAVVIAGELLKKSEELLEQDVHPTVITLGYRQAAEKAQELLKTIAVDVKAKDKEILAKIAGTAMTGKNAEASKDKLCDLIVRAITLVADADGTVDTENVKVEKRVGGAIEDSEIVEGMIIDKERVHPGMPKTVKSAKILLLNAAVEYKKTEVDAEISITSPDQLQLFLDEEERMIKGIVEKIKASGANVLFCQKGIDDIAQHYLSKAGILAVRRVKKSDMEKLARATGGALISSIDAISADELGVAGLVEERKVGGEEMIFVEKCKNPKAVSIIIKGGTEHVVDELGRALEDALRVVGVVVEDKKIVAGGGAPEVELSLRLREYAATQGGRIQLAIEAFASALEVIPRTLAENAGLDPIDKLVELRAAHEKGKKTFGLDVFEGKPVDMLAAGVVEPLRVKTQAIASAAEAAVMILRIDDVIASAKSAGPSPEEMAAMGGAGGMGGMPGGMPGMM
ncbi:thermosome subunit alpha [Methanocorpusculum vombati]|uniref:Thermosome subunit alpha n=1 Tax=Methanocorpusculum vombati TaxID=3002864 RepID=A0ABT4ILB2_9EURY|nr:thermosome subunit alpha [Methanocorpusculum vombati]MCZ9318784.1 thermosome subunit alpha [Methanocorpusculum sp.]MCZ0862521.1 thermosome subunit alpha [Methanocorpusculum vombati]MDE2521426.1 thermosome subunit alpha [Methanocorpusculum sp.]MDE2533912.1 thermosome subunit alpha [Methanocorpusculum sp.]MDE2548017.1 thermosome subunit alpha [Methanocorpusculum sp.]